MRRKLAAGNWKMNGLAASLPEAGSLARAHSGSDCDILLCPPATLLSRMADVLKGSAVALGGQDCNAAQSGAHTGDVSAEMLRDAGASHVIVGHSERRTDHCETSAIVAAKVRAAHEAGLVTIVCIGETEAQRDVGDALNVIAAQLKGSLTKGCTATNTVIAYEPVWAIGTGRTAEPGQIQEVHGFLRDQLVKLVPDAAPGIRLIYGGSVKPANAADIFDLPDVDGALVGGASLTAADFGAIITALEAS